MRTLIAYATCILALVGSGCTQELRQVDFKKFLYKWSEPRGRQHKLEWLPMTSSAAIPLVNGRWALPQDSQEVTEPVGRFAGLSFESVVFGDVTSDRSEQAIVDLRYDSGGTQHWHCVYFYTMELTRPKQLGYFHTGDRAASGLYRVYPNSGELTVVVYDPSEQSGDCCSSGFVRMSYA
jgi:hypothetical protein